MGLFGKKEACPVCGGQVKGLFNKKIGNKKTLCKDCSEQISMTKELLKNATPEFVMEHLEYRRENAVKFNTLSWDLKCFARELTVGVDTTERFLYISEPELDDLDNPVVFSFDQITHYELYRLKKKLDDSDTPGETPLSSGLDAAFSLARLATNKESDVREYFRLVLTTTDPYWPVIDIKIHFESDDLYGWGGFADQLKEICQVFKQVVRKEQINLL